MNFHLEKDGQTFCNALLRHSTVVHDDEGIVLPDGVYGLEVEGFYLGETSDPQGDIKDLLELESVLYDFIDTVAEEAEGSWDTVRELITFLADIEAEDIDLQDSEAALGWLEGTYSEWGLSELYDALTAEIESLSYDDLVVEGIEVFGITPHALGHVVAREALAEAMEEDYIHRGAVKVDDTVYYRSSQ